MDEPEHLGALLQTLRLRAGLTHEQVRARTGVSQAYSYWLETRYSAPSHALLDRILTELNATDAERVLAVRLAARAQPRDRRTKRSGEPRQPRARTRFGKWNPEWVQPTPGEDTSDAPTAEGDAPAVKRGAA